MAAHKPNWRLKQLPSRALRVLLHVYQYLLSPWFGSSCRFIPCCSDYALLSLERFGFFKAVWLISRRLLRCHPWHEGGFDEVPEATNLALLELKETSVKSSRIANTRSSTKACSLARSAPSRDDDATNLKP